MYKIIIFFYLGFSLSVSAESLVVGSQKESIESLVKQVKTAKPSEKRVLMNKLKVQLRQSNQTHRMQIMKEIKQSFSTGNRIDQGKQRRKYRFEPSHSGKHQPKYRQRQGGNGAGKKGSGRNGGGTRH
ncbi:MAG: hypothetical protein U9N11_02620 [Campylobacterota bacterium]|nr:hypothetical protein [Campylobacterota bacterium]